MARFIRLALRIGLLPGPGGLVRPGLAIALLTWVPLALLAAIDGGLYEGAPISFSQSIGTHVRLLVAIPLLFFAEAIFDRRVADVLRRIVEVGLVLPRDEPRLAAAVRDAITVAQLVGGRSRTRAPGDRDDLGGPAH